MKTNPSQLLSRRCTDIRSKPSSQTLLRGAENAFMSKITFCTQPTTIRQCKKMTAGGASVNRRSRTRAYALILSVISNDRDSNIKILSQALDRESPTGLGSVAQKPAWLVERTGFELPRPVESPL
jgi:hypothetical protein